MTGIGGQWGRITIGSGLGSVFMAIGGVGCWRWCEECARWVELAWAQKNVNVNESESLVGRHLSGCAQFGKWLSVAISIVVNAPLTPQVTYFFRDNFILSAAGIVCQLNLWTEISAFAHVWWRCQGCRQGSKCDVAQEEQRVWYRSCAIQWAVYLVFKWPFCTRT